MKKIILIMLLLTSSMMANKITVRITDILNKNGTVYIGLYNKADDFAIVANSYMGAVIEIDTDKLTYIFKEIPNGIYAISIFHDENKNKKLDKNFFNIPSEGYGFSNNIRPNFRSANFEESKFELNRDIELSVKMGY